MSVIPLIRDVTVVESMNHFDREGSRILILNLDPGQLRPEDETESNLTYDLRVGEEYRDHRDSGKRDTGPQGEIVVFAGRGVIIQAVEHVYPPRERFAYIVPKVSLLQEGISNTSSKVDAGYPGPLLITVFNLGKTIVRLRRGDKFCTIVFHDVWNPLTARLYNKEPKRILGAGRMSKWQQFRDLMDRNTGTLAAIALGTSVVFGLITVVLVVIEASLFHFLVTHR